MKQLLGHRVRGFTAGAAALLLAGTLAACGQQFGNSAAPRPVAELADAVDCTAAQRIVESGTQPTAAAEEPPAAGSVPADFVPVEAILCAAALETVEDQDGRWSAVTEERLGGNLDPLLAALAQPSDGPGPNQVCTADMEMVPDLWLLAADGKAMRAAWPADSCGKTKPGVHVVLADMDVTGSSQHKVVLIQSRAALDAGCPDAWSISVLPGTVMLTPMTVGPGAAAGNGIGEEMPASPGILPEPDDVDTLRICRYQTTPAPAPSPDAPAGQPSGAQPDASFDVIETVSGTFSGGGNLSGPAKDAVLQAAASGPGAAECGATPSAFAALWPVVNGRDAGTPLTLELDGCRRLVSIDGSVRTVPEDAAAAVVTAVAD